MTNKKNIIITSLLLVLALAIGVVVSIECISFRNYETAFALREDVVNEIIKFSDYSKNLKGTIGDSNIYVINGTDNSVAVTKLANKEKFNTLDAVKSAKVALVKGTRQVEAMELAEIQNVYEYDTVEDAVTNMNSNNTDVCVLAYQDAKALVQNNQNYCILDVEVEKIPSLLVIGGTHPNEPSGQLTATVILENAKVERGILYVVTELNRSAYSYSQPQEATTWYFDIKTASGQTRTFKFGSRATNTVDQWPTPDVYTHSSGQQLSSSEVRNINRAYPGSETGTYTEQIAYAITNFINKKDVTMVIDLHEASPEYLTINACVYHQDAGQIVNKVRQGFKKVDVEGNTTKVDIKFDESPLTMHGLTHRELGDFTNAYVFLFETSNAAQGKLRGAFTEDLITYAKPDKFYEAAVAYDEANGTEIIYGRPCSINERVARHTLSVLNVIEGFNTNCVTRTVSVADASRSAYVGTGGEYIGKFIVSGIPGYGDIYTNGVGNYLLDIETTK